MNSIPKYLLLDIFNRLNLIDLCSSCLINSTTYEICSNNDFWKKKRLTDFPEKPFPTNSKFNEMEKYRRLTLSGTLYLWSEKLDMGDDFDYDRPFRWGIYPEKFLFKGAPMFVLKALPYSLADEAGVYILTCTGELYIIGNDIVSFNLYHRQAFRRSNKYDEPKLIMSNVYDIYIGRRGELFVKTKLGNIFQYVEKRLVEIWKFGGVIKLIPGLILTANGKLYSSPTTVKREHVKDFVATPKFIYYLTTDSNLIVEEYLLADKYRLDFSQGDKLISSRTLATDVKEFSANQDDYGYINQYNNLYIGRVGETPVLVSSDVHHLVIDGNTTFYIKRDLALFKYMRTSQTSKRVANISNVLNVWSAFDVQSAIVKDI